ncbi:hypothetical protein LWI28_013828 [Acer negundo]|uniref:Tf2-1-like SH3-like domain-containing protein n=1 Tax=Acer negundo TaxID=4023 RepID=A0AAD5NZM4_ACENE|nr:hypothetical protein LWI28_013828 [Acer negundo]
MSTLGDITWNLNKLKMKFQVSGKVLELNGLQNLEIQQMAKLLHKLSTEIKETMKLYNITVGTTNGGKVLDQNGKIVYKLDLPPFAAIHYTFHASQLKKKVPSIRKIKPLLSPPSSSPVPVAIFACRVVKGQNQAATQVMIQ